MADADAAGTITSDERPTIEYLMEELAALKQAMSFLKPELSETPDTTDAQKAENRKLAEFMRVNAAKCKDRNQFFDLVRQANNRKAVFDLARAIENGADLRRNQFVNAMGLPFNAASQVQFDESMFL